jgi:ribonuclease BN (tRNA processing enzyme)
MRIEVLGAYGGQSDRCRTTCLLFNGRLALDAGSLAQGLPLERQQEIDTIVLSHSHMDHTSSLPFFIENVYERGSGEITVWASEATTYAIRKYLLNNDAWPDFTRLPNNLLPAVRFRELIEEDPVVLEGLRITPIAVEHRVPTFGFLIEQDNVAVLWSSDTGPTFRFWEIANRTPNLKAVFIETSFDNSMQEIADLSLHLTPRSLGTELAKLERVLPIFIHHMKPPCVTKIRREVDALGDPRVRFLEQGRTYEL